MRPLHPLCFALLLAVAFSGCNLVGGDDFCTGLAEPAIVVEVRNAETGAPEAKNAGGTIVEGGYVDSLVVYGYTRELEPLELAAGFERTGTYDVRVEKAGFETWRREGVEVESDKCGPSTERLEAELVPDP